MDGEADCPSSLPLELIFTAAFLSSNYKKKKKTVKWRLLPASILKQSWSSGFSDIYKPDMSVSFICSQTSSVSEFHQQPLMNVCVGGSLVDTGNYCSFCGAHLQELEPCNHITPAHNQSMQYKSMTALSFHAPHFETSSSMWYEDQWIHRGPSVRHWFCK